MAPRRRRSLVGFSPFARSLARLHARRNLNHPISSSKSHQKPRTKASALSRTSKKKNKFFEPSDEEDENLVQVNFEFFDPKLGDFHGVKNLLQTYLDNEQWDLSSFVDLILSQTRVGTVVKIEDEEDESLFSVVSAINLNQNIQCIMELKKFLLKVCNETDIKDSLMLLLGDQAQGVALLVSQRVVNFPPQLLPPLYDALFDEILWATEDEPTVELQESFRFKCYLLITRVYKNKNADKLKGTCDDPIIYPKPEDEFFHKLSAWSFTFSICTQQLAPRELRNYQLMGLVMLIQEDRISEFREELRSSIAEE